MSVFSTEISEGIRGRLGRAALLFTFLFITLMGRLFYVQILRGDEYRAAAQTSFTSSERLPARRGEIRDRNGVVLAKNTPVRRLQLVPDHLKDPKVLEEVLGRIGQVLELRTDEIDELFAKVTEANESQQLQAIVVQEALVEDKCPYDGAPLEIPAKPPKEADAESLLFCRDSGQYYEPLARAELHCPHDRQALTWEEAGQGALAQCSKCERHYADGALCPETGRAMEEVHHNLLCPVCKRRFANQVAILKSMPNLTGVLIDTNLAREYTQPFTAAHVLGYINYVNREDLEENPGVYALDSKRGRAGIEASQEPILRGSAGQVQYVKGTHRTVEHSRIESEPGADVWLTLDARLQQEVRQIMRYHQSGAAVVMEPNTGEILAMYSHPGFDSNAWSGRLSREAWEAVSQNPYDPLHNKAVTAYAPGSVFKIVTALAGMKEGLITPETEHDCEGFYHFRGRDFRCHLRTGHGPMDLVDAMAASCDVYFYKVAEELGMDKLAEYARQFGFGSTTGIEIAESPGIVPTIAWYNENTSRKYQPGLKLSVGIGQGSLTASPLQVAQSFAVIANGGRLMQPQLIRRYVGEDPSDGQEFLPIEIARVSMTPQELALIEEGLLAVVNEELGTGKLAADDALLLAGKSGTAEAAMSRIGASPEVAEWLLKDHAWFVAYGPVPNPQVVIVVFLEHGGGGGQNAAPVVKRIFDAWKRLGLYQPPPEDDDGRPGMRRQPPHRGR